MLNQIKDASKNILTIEDPVEYQLERVNQVQIKPVIGLTFARGLRSFLRLDPDVIMVGEIRDKETAQICVRASLTGHLVLSTLHTNDAPTSIIRMIDIGVEPFLLAPSLALVAAQRLLRLLCPKCKKPFHYNKSVLKQLHLENAEELYEAKGCDHCNQTGYYGRSGIFEVGAVDDDIKEAILKGASTIEIRNLFKKKGMTNMREQGLEKAKRGETTIEEVLNVTFDSD